MAKFVQDNLGFLLSLFDIKEGTLKSIGMQTNTYDSGKIYKISKLLFDKEILKEKHGWFLWNNGHNGRKEKIYMIDHNSLGDLIYADWIYGYKMYRLIIEGRIGLIPPKKQKPENVTE